MKKVVVLGGGFGGVAAIHALLKQIKNSDVEITLVDKNSFHSFCPSYYEVATSEEPKGNVAIPFFELFGNRVTAIRDDVESINIKENKVNLAGGEKLPYDYLIIALGSETAYYGIEGLRGFSIPLKTLEDAVKIKQAIKEKYHEKIKRNQGIRVLVGGGGFSGTELAAELVRFREHLARHHQKSEDCMEIGIIQGSDCLLKGLDKKVRDIATKRLEDGSITSYFGAHIKKVTKERVETDDGKIYPYDVLIWTGGVRANSIVRSSAISLSEHGRIIVNNYLQAVGAENVFAAGDIAGFVDGASQKETPMIAQVAEEQGKMAGENTARLISGHNLLPYRYRHFGYILPMRGYFAVAVFKGFFISGFSGWVIQQLVFLRYLLGILPIRKAFKRWDKFEMYLMK